MWQTVSTLQESGSSALVGARGLHGLGSEQGHSAVVSSQTKDTADQPLAGKFLSTWTTPLRSKTGKTVGLWQLDLQESAEIARLVQDQSDAEGGNVVNPTLLAAVRFPRFRVPMNL